MNKNLPAYFKEKQYIARVDKKGNVLGKIEKWEAHRKGILHKAFTIVLMIEDSYIVQHRKHPAFGGTLDVTISSHQLFINGELEDTITAAFNTLQREWNITKKDLVKPLSIDGSIYYKAKDKYSEFIEHEVCEVLTAHIKNPTPPNFDFAYGYSLVTKEELMEKNTRFENNLAPWVKTMIKEKLL